MRGTIPPSAPADPEGGAVDGASTVVTLTSVAAPFVTATRTAVASSPIHTGSDLRSVTAAVPAASAVPASAWLSESPSVFAAVDHVPSARWAWIVKLAEGSPSQLTPTTSAPSTGVGAEVHPGCTVCVGGATATSSLVGAGGAGSSVANTGPPRSTRATAGTISKRRMEEGGSSSAGSEHCEQPRPPDSR